MKKIFLIALIGFVLVINNNLFAEGDAPVVPANAKATITGKVIDNITGESLVGVSVTVEGTDIKAYSDLDGNFSLNAVDPGNYNLILSLISYKNSLVENVKINPGQKEVIDIKLNSVR